MAISKATEGPLHHANPTVAGVSKCLMRLVDRIYERRPHSGIRQNAKTALLAINVCINVYKQIPKLGDQIAWFQILAFTSTSSKTPLCIVLLSCYITHHIRETMIFKIWLSHLSTCSGRFVSRVSFSRLDRMWDHVCLQVEQTLFQHPLMLTFPLSGGRSPRVQFLPPSSK